MRKLANEHKTLSKRDILSLLRSPSHEARLFSLIIFVRSFSKADETANRQIYDLYLDNTKYINNWDLVDVSAPHIVGAFLMNKSKTPLYGEH